METRTTTASAICRMAASLSMGNSDHAGLLVTMVTKWVAGLGLVASAASARKIAL